MEDLIREIANNKLKDIHTHTLKDESIILEASQYSQESLVGKYLVIPMSLSVMNKISESSDALGQFEDSNIAPFFFNMEGDLSWNLYILFVLSQEDYDHLDLKGKMLLERGKRYGRKYIVPRSKLSDYLPVAKLEDDIGQLLKVNPYEDWYEKLGLSGLTFCLDRYSGAFITRYLEGNPVDRHVDGSGADILLEDHDSDRSLSNPMTINRLGFGNKFRSHCWAENKEIPFTQVNLIEGTNGSGKTSILEAIELAFTGQISRNKMPDSEISEKWDGQLYYWDGTDNQLAEGLPSFSEQQNRERRYYQYRARTRVRTSLLNQFYHRYNYFTSEDIFRFCYDKKEKLDFRNEFARIIFGEELSLFEENWQKYKTEFQNNSRNISENTREKSIKKEMLEQEIREGSALMSASLKSIFPLVKKLLTQVWLNYPLYDESSATRVELQQWFEALYPHLSEVEGMSRPLEEAEKAGYADTAQLVEEAQKWEGVKRDLQELRTKFLEQEKNLPDESVLQEQLNENREKLNDSKSQDIILSEFVGYIAQNRLLLDESDKRNYRNKINDTIYESEKWLLNLERIQQQWAHISDAHFEYDHRHSADECFFALEKQQEDNKNKLLEVAELIKTEETNADLLQKLLTQIKSFGEAYIKEEPDNSVCPMCGHNHGTAKTLQTMIEKDMEQEQQHLRDLHEKKHMLEKQKRSIQTDIDKVKFQVGLFENLELVYKDLKENETFLDFSIPSQENSTPSPRQIIIWLNQVSELYKKLQKQHENWKREASLLDESGFTLENISKLEDKLNSVEMKDRVKVFSSSEEMIHSLNEDLRKLKQNKLNLEKKINKQELHIQKVRLQWKDIKEQKYSVEKEEIIIRQRINHTKQICKLLDQLKQKGIYLKDKMKFGEWRTSTTKLLEEVKMALDLFQNNGNISEKESALQKLERELDELRRQDNYCQAALIDLNGLQPLSYYIQEFLTNNITRINDIFLRLHTPQDFERLELNDREELIAYRRGHHDETTCSINQMSTGQRTAVILSIFFVMHMSMETAPNILLLDEPVANMDDLNVLGLLDFLRQFTLTRNTQIFFTTANPAVASLFRRKFSILKERFQAYQLHRMDGQRAIVNIQTYLPEKESGIDVV